MKVNLITTQQVRHPVTDGLLLDVGEPVTKNYLGYLVHAYGINNVALRAEVIPTRPSDYDLELLVNKHHGSTT